MANLVVHFEIYGSEPERLVEFYSALFGWRITRAGEMEYWLVETDPAAGAGEAPSAGINGGLAQREGPRPEPGAPVNGCDLVVGVDDVDGMFAKSVELGATEALPPADMVGVGRIAYVNDPDGNLFGMLSPVLSDGTNVLDTPSARSV
ncbi:VOC family protein [Agromyces bauzanensis]